MVDVYGILVIVEMIIKHFIEGNRKMRDNTKKARTGVFYEVYVKGPNGETGWDIKTGWVKSSSVESSKAMIKETYGADFDCFIQCYYACMNKEDKYAIVQNPYHAVDLFVDFLCGK